jgi:hypothetical protein
MDHYYIPRQTFPGNIKSFLFLFKNGAGGLVKRIDRGAG